MDRARSGNPGCFPLGLAIALALGCSGSAAGLGLLPDAGGDEPPGPSQDSQETPNELGRDAATRIDAGVDLASPEAPPDVGAEAQAACSAGMTGQSCSTAGQKCTDPCAEGRVWTCRCEQAASVAGLSWVCTTGGESCRPDGG
jgi:hypothetical protein